MATELAKSYSFLDVPGCRFSKVGLEIEPGFAFDHWERLTEKLVEVGSAHQWWIGDVLRYGEREYGELSSQAMKERTGYEPQTIMNFIWVAGRIEISRRRENVPWSLHAELASFDVLEQERWLKRIVKENLTQKELRNAIRLSGIAEQIALIEALPPIEGKFRVIVADPPWKYSNRAEDETHRAANPYPSMETDDIAALPIADHSLDDAILWLWTTNAFMVEAHLVAEAWGFTVKTILTWKKSKIGLGDWLRGITEHCLLAVRGKPVVNLTNQTTHLQGPLREHSRKPIEFYQMVETLCPGTKLELFSRETRPGWTCSGAEVGKFS
jgi:N6-adenosine-specific RNA methylase IME4